MKVGTKSSALLTGNVGRSSPAAQSTVSLEEMELVPMESRNSHTAYHNMALDCAPLSNRLTDPLCARLHALCHHDFRAESWYLDNLLLIMSFVIGFACLILLSIGLDDLIPLLFTTFGVIPYWLLISLVCVNTIPLCGIVSMVQQTDPSQRHSPFVLRLAVDSGMPYRVSRGLFFALAPIFGTIYSTLSWHLRRTVTPWYNHYYAIIAPGIWCVACIVISCYASCSCLWSLYSELFSNSGYSKQCDYQPAGTS